MKEMEMASTCSIDRVLLDLKLLVNNPIVGFYPSNKYKSEAALREIKFLKTFVMCARKRSHSNDLYLESDSILKKVILPSFLSRVEDTVHKYEQNIHSLSFSLELDDNDEEDLAIVAHPSTERYGKLFSAAFVCSRFVEQIRSFKEEIIQLYFTLASSVSLQQNSCMRDDELMEFVDLILQNLADLTTVCLSLSTTSAAVLTAQNQDLEVKLTFLKSFIPFAKLRGTVDIPALLLAHFEVVALEAARLSYMCSFWEGYTPEFCSMICEEQQKIKPVDFQVYEIYMEVLRPTRSSKSLDSPMMDKQIMNNFNDSLISHLWELLCCSSNFVDSMKDEMQILYEGLRFLRSILRQHQEKMDEQNERIEALLSEAGVIIFSPSLNRVNEGKVNFLESTEALDCYDMLANTNIHIKHIKDQICGSSITERLPSSHSLTVQEAWKPASHMLSKRKIPVTHEVTVGLDDEVEKVIERLTSGPDQLEIVPIVGMAGLGKTTLAKKVYNDSSVVYDFHIRLWCTVPQAYNMKDVLLQILCSDGKHSKMNEEFSDRDEHALLQKLYKKLKGNRYLVVFDDVWDFKAWNELRCSFPDEENRSRIIFTSRFSDVVSQVQYGGEPHNLRPLSEKESFDLLQKKVFGGEACPQALCGFAMEIAKKCGGIPLAVVVVAGVLETLEHDNLAWKEFAKSLTSTMVSGTDECKKSLELSYERLPHHLKACLLYFAAFQEDEKIGAKNLMLLWIAEGLVEKIEGRRAEDIAEEYLMDLIVRNLVMVSESRSIGGVKTCYVHDLIFEFCKVESKAKNFLQVVRGYDELSTFNEPPNLPRLSIFSNGADFLKSRLFCPHLDSLLFFDIRAGQYERKLLNISFLFCIYKDLKVLNLERIKLGLKELPTEVESLLRLRYLVLTAEQMQYIRPSIAKLSNLETFCLNSRARVLLPDSIWNMKQLRHVHVRSGFRAFPFSSNDDIVENLPTLPNLDTLSTLCLYLDLEGENILRRIPNIRQLKIHLLFGEGGCCDMSGLECLESLTLYRDYSSSPPDHIELSFPMNLKKLHLANLGLPCSTMSLIEQLPNLEVLKLGRDALGGERWELMEGGFPELRVLILSGLDIVEWIEADPDSGDYFPCLQQLKLHSIRYLKTFPSCLGRISTLEMIEVKDTRGRVTSLIREIEEAQKNYGNENLRTIYEEW